VFCTIALSTWKLDATDVSRMAGHANYRTTLDMYVTTAGVLDRARTATPIIHVRLRTQVAESARLGVGSPHMANFRPRGHRVSAN
jgi:hypothetical protein